MDVFAAAVTGTRPHRRRPACYHHAYAAGPLCAPLHCATERRGNAWPRSPPPRPLRCRSPHLAAREQSRVRDSGDGGGCGCPAPRLPRALGWPRAARRGAPPTAGCCLAAHAGSHGRSPAVPCRAASACRWPCLAAAASACRMPWELVGSSARAKRRRVKGLGRFGGGRWSS